jgi:hypothetical protein
MDAVSIYGALTLMNRGNWFLTCRGPSKEYVFDDENRIISRKKNSIIGFFIVKNKLSEGGC